MSGWAAYRAGVTCAGCAFNLGLDPDEFNEITGEPQRPPGAPTHTERPGCLEFKGVKRGTTAPGFVSQGKESQRKKMGRRFEDIETVYNELAAALGESNPDYTRKTGPKHLLPRAADAILELMPPPEWSEADEAAWEPFLKGKKGDD